MSIVDFGSFVVDLTSRSKGFPVPGQTILGNSFRYGPGGKGSNQAVAAHRAGADVTFVTKLGKDAFGQIALDFYRKEGMNTDYILEEEGLSTSVAQIMVDEESAQNAIIVIIDACGKISEQDVEKCRKLVESANILLLQHEINMDAQYRVIDIAHRAGVRIVLNPAPAAPIPDEIMAKIDIVTPNETEAEVLTGIHVANAADARRAAECFLKKGVRQVVITLGAMGAYAFDGVREELLPRIPVEAVDTTGAGDAFNGGFAMALDAGMDLFTALRYGNVTGALSVTRYGTAPAMPTREEIDRLYAATYGTK